MASKDFPFVVSSGPRVPQDSALRTLIRKQAMKDVGIARKKRGTYGRTNIRQAPPVEECTITQKEASVESISSDARSSERASGMNSNSPEKETSSTDAITPEEVTSHVNPVVHARRRKAIEDWMHPLRQNPPTAYESLRIKYHIDIQDLSGLTSFNVGRTTMMAIAIRPDLLVTLLGHEMSTYLQFIPSRYGRSPALTAVADCVVAKVHGALYPHNTKSAASVMRLYSKALRELQGGISDQRACSDPDLLCAVEMLTIYEVSRETTEDVSRTNAAM